MTDLIGPPRNFQRRIRYGEEEKVAEEEEKEREIDTEKQRIEEEKKRERERRWKGRRGGGLCRRSGWNGWMEALWWIRRYILSESWVQDKRIERLFLSFFLFNQIPFNSYFLYPVVFQSNEMNSFKYTDWLIISILIVKQKIWFKPARCHINALIRTANSKSISVWDTIDGDIANMFTMCACFIDLVTYTAQSTHSI